MEPRDEESRKETGQPLLPRNTGEEGDGTAGARSDASLLEKAVSEGATGAAVLAKHLPTGAALVFQVLSPITTARGNCQSITRIETISLIVICAISCMVLNFTDSFRDSGGKLRYGIATYIYWYICFRQNTTSSRPEQVPD